MQYTYAFPLKCAEHIKHLALNYAKDYYTKNIYVLSLTSIDSIRTVIDAELKELDLPEVYNIILFKRRNYKISSAVHIDSSDLQETIHASIIVPIEGCEQTYMYWIEGNYEYKQSFTENGIEFKKLFWTGPKKLAKCEEITSTVVCRVDIPHSASSRLDGTYRTIVSIRLKGNPTVEEILEKINSK